MYFIIRSLTHVATRTFDISSGFGRAVDLRLISTSTPAPGFLDLQCQHLTRHR